jgi:hypothetical protein
MSGWSTCGKNVNGKVRMLSLKEGGRNTVSLTPAEAADFPRVRDIEVGPLAAMWGTIENLAPSSSQTRDAAEDSCINIRKGEVYRDEVFITFGGPAGP